MNKTCQFLTYFCTLSIFLLGSCKKKEVDPIPPITSTYDINLALGNPSNASKDINTPSNYLLQKAEYTLSYNSTIGTANWVSWKLSLSSLGSTPRQDDFRADNAIPAQWYRVTETDYSGSGFDRGHLCPSGDRTNNVTSNSSTFLMSNIIPQAPNNNQYTWQDLESYCRDLVYSGNELYIIAGPHGSGGTGSSGGVTYSLMGGKIIVPQSLWKIIVVLSPGSSNANNVTTSTRVIAVKMPNTQTVITQPWGYYRTSVDQIETLTGYNFLSEVPISIQNSIEASVDSGPTF